MVDLLFAVEDPLVWHTENLQRNPSHYSFLKHFGASSIAQVNAAAGVYFNTMVHHKGLYLKYGVKDLTGFNEDLEGWDSLYLAGRLHKPVLMLDAHTSRDARTQKALSTNLQSAVRVAMLMWTEELTRTAAAEGKGYISEEELFMRIAGLSYLGDIRQGIAENPRKTANIVQGNLDGFRELYRPVVDGMAELEATEKGENGDRVYSLTGPDATSALLADLPSSLRGCGPAELEPRLREITKKSSLRQTAYGVLTAGPFKSIVYAARKFGKANFSDS
jgi:translocator assembly and maintenance protein 41